MMNNFRKIALSVVAFLFVGQLSVTVSAQPASPPQPKNIIVLFADGVTGSQWEFGRKTSELIRQKPFLVTDVVMKTGHFGLMTSHPANAYITDSAAAASAMSTGFKVNNGSISITPDGQRPATLAQVAKDQGKRIGLITTATVYDASPAAFSVHSKSRRDSENIVNQYLALEPDLLMGGGAEYFLPKSVEGGKRLDDKNMIELFASKGYQIARQPEDLNTLRGNRLLGLFANEDLDFEIDRESKEQPNLAQMTTAALKVLTQANAPSTVEKGFFLFVENENTDTAGHRNDAAALMRDLWAFDEAVQIALDFQKQNPDTLVIVTGDHETAGFSPTYARKTKAPAGAGNEIRVADQQIKFIANFKTSLDEISKKLKARAKQGADQAAMKSYFAELVSEGLPGLIIEPDLEKLVLEGQATDLNYSYLPANTIGQMIARQTGFYWASSGHTNQPVVVAAMGPGSQLFQGYHDNTDFAKIVRTLMGVK